MGYNSLFYKENSCVTHLYWDIYTKSGSGRRSEVDGEYCRWMVWRGNVWMDAGVSLIKKRVMTVRGAWAV